MLEKKYDIILSYEESFARIVAIRMIIERPLSIWHYLIPFLFLFEFLRRRKETRIFSENFLFVKKLALDVSLDINKGEDRQNRAAKIEDEIKDRLTSQNLYSWEIHQKQIAEVNLLIDHYCKLLNAEGKSYESLVKNAYQTQDNYKAFLRQLTSAEKAIDRAVIKTLGETEEIGEEIAKKRRIIDEIRAKGIDKIFQKAR